MRPHQKEARDSLPRLLFAFRLPAGHQVDEAHLRAVGDFAPLVLLFGDDLAVDGDDDVRMGVAQPPLQLGDG